MKNTLTYIASTLLAAALASACAHIQPARMALPAVLAGDAAHFEELPVQGIGGKARGSFQLGEAAGRYERSASRLALFDAALAFNRGSASYTLNRTDGVTIEGSCSQRQTEAQRGILSAPVRPYTVHCNWGDGARLTLDAELLAAGGTQQARQGRFEAGGVQLELRSVHQLQGSKLPLAQAAGYTLLHRGVPVGALELTSGTPRLWRPRAGQPLHDAVTQAALALALLWDPATL